MVMVMVVVLLLVVVVLLMMVVVVLVLVVVLMLVGSNKSHLFNVMKVLVAELQHKLLLDLVEVNQFIPEDVHHHPCLVQSLHLDIRTMSLPTKFH